MNAKAYSPLFWPWRIKKSLLVEGQMGRVAGIYKTLSVGQDLAMDSTIVLFRIILEKRWNPF